MNTRKIILLLTTFILTSGIASGAYTKVECSTDPSFQANSCDQCFDGGTKAQGDNIGLLSDEWINSSSSDQLIYKEEQEDPELINLGGGDSSWSDQKSGDTFWEYTKDLENLYSEDDGGYILPAGSKVPWIQSKLDSAYKLEKSSAQSGLNIGMIIYPIAVHNILSNGDVTFNSDVYNECVLFKSGDSSGQSVPIIVTKKPSSLPNTGPEHVLLIVLAGILSLMVIRKKKQA